MIPELNPLLEIFPFDEAYAVKASIDIPEESRKFFIPKSFLMFVLQIRSGMDESSIKQLKSFILQTCQELISKGGIDNIGFVINKSYHTIRNPNLEGIKDLLNLYISVEDTTDIRQTIICLRNSIYKEAKKMEESKISIVFFTSNVAEDKLNPVKRTHRLKMNSHIRNYENEIKKLKKTIDNLCDDCYFYSICFVKKYNNQKQKQFGWIGCGQYNREGVDVSLIYELGYICKRKKLSINVCESYSELGQKFAEVSALILYEFHQFSIMVPIISSKKELFSPEETKLKDLLKLEQEKEQIYEQGEDIQDEVLQDYFKKNEVKEQKIEDLDESESEEDPQQIQYIANEQRKIKYARINLSNFGGSNIEQAKFLADKNIIFSKTELDLKQLHDNGYHVFKKVEKKKQLQFPIKKRLAKKLLFIYTPEYVSKNVDYKQPNSIELIKFRSEFFKDQITDIIDKVRNDLLKYKKRFIGTFKKTKIFQTYIEVNQQLQNQQRSRLYHISKTAKQMYETIFKDELIKNMNEKRNMFELYSSLKHMIDSAEEVFLSIYKKQVNNKDINKLTNAINYDRIKSSLKRKLIKRVNSNPKMVNQVYERVQEICQKQINNYVALQSKYRYEKSEVGNCMYTFKNFATALKDKDCIGIVFELERPQAAIADPGRIRIRQVSTLVSCVSKFFQVHQYLMPQSYEITFQKQLQRICTNINQQKVQETYSYCPFCQLQCGLQSFFDIRSVIQARNKVEATEINKIYEMRKKTNFGIRKDDYKQNWDYWNRVQNKNTYFGIMPLYVCPENWKVAKQMMKICMGWNACGEPLGYTYSQTQTIPFMILSNLIRLVQQEEYKIKQLQEKSKIQHSEKERNGLLHEANAIKHKRERYIQLLKHVELTCQAIVQDMSQHKQFPFDQQIIEKYLNYEKPICRTVDIINNNSSFISQLYTVIKLGKLEKPSEQKFHEFFKRLIEQQMRRETDGWNQQEVQQKFINKLLNVQIQKMDKPKYVVFQSEYVDKFENALKGNIVYRTEFQIQRQALQMVIKQNNSFNQTQRMTLIEYKRLYQNRVLWLWYVRFRLYEQKERLTIHKWKCIDLTNSYQLFTMIIQNKKQRKNWKRRQAILNGNYIDPFDYYPSREYLQHQFMLMRKKKQAQNIILLHQQKYGRASQVFAMTKDLREAAGAIMNIAIGKQIVFFFNQLMHESRLIEQKLKMLLNGEHEGVQLFKHGWKMSKRRWRLLSHKYPYQFMRFKYMF